MKIILLIAATLFAKNVFSQTLDMQQRNLWKNYTGKTGSPKFYLPQTFKLMLTQQRGDTIFDKSVAKIELTKEYAANNGRGADVYIMKPYNMPCLIPDSTFHSNMPVKGFTVVQQPMH